MTNYIVNNYYNITLNQKLKNLIVSLARILQRTQLNIAYRHRYDSNIRFSVLLNLRINFHL